MPAEMADLDQDGMIRPLGSGVTADTTAAEALSLMMREGVSVLPVLRPGGAELLGLVLRPGLEHACVANGHVPERCPVINHVSPGVERVRAEELKARLAGRPASPRRGGRRRGSRVPVVVVDERGAPIGYAEPETEG